MNHGIVAHHHAMAHDGGVDFMRDMHGRARAEHEPVADPHRLAIGPEHHEGRQHRPMPQGHLTQQADTRPADRRVREGRDDTVERQRQRRTMGQMFDHRGAILSGRFKDVEHRTGAKPMPTFAPML